MSTRAPRVAVELIEIISVIVVPELTARRAALVIVAVSAIAALAGIVAWTTTVSALIVTVCATVLAPAVLRVADIGKLSVVATVDDTRLDTCAKVEMVAPVETDVAAKRAVVALEEMLAVSGMATSTLPE